MKLDADGHPIFAHGFFVIVAALLLLTGACSDPPGEDPGPDGVGFDVEQFLTDIQANVEEVGFQLADGIEYADRAATFADVDDELGLRAEFCSSGVASPWNDIDACRDAPTRSDLHSFIDDFSEELIPHVFVEDNLAHQTSDMLRYELDGQTTCNTTDCANWLDDQQLILEVTSPRAGDYDIDVTVGAVDAALATVEIYDGRLGVDVDLEELVAAFSSMEPSRAMPEVATGEVGIRADIDGNASVVALDIISEVNIVDGDFELTFGPSHDTLQLTMNAIDEILSATVNANKLNFQYIDNSYEPDAGAYVDALIQFEIPSTFTDIHFEDNPSQIVIDGLTFGSEPARLLFDDEVEAELTLNPDDGRQFQGFVSWEDDFTVRVDPTFDIVLDMKFQRIRRLGVDVYDWMQDETLRAYFANATEPTLTHASDVLEVLSGELSLESESSGDIFVPQGQCLTGGSWNPHPFSTFSVDPC